MTHNISLDSAKQMLNAAEDRAETLDVRMNLAVTNREGNLVAFRRMDGAKLVATNIAQNKAYTAAAVKKPTHKLKESAEPGGDVYGLETTDRGRIIVFGGGFPIERDGDIVGAVGVSGGDVSEDMEVARAALDTFDSESE